LAVRGFELRASLGRRATAGDKPLWCWVFLRQGLALLPGLALNW
jgi:hypothetical protein